MGPVASAAAGAGRTSVTTGGALMPSRRSTTDVVPLLRGAGLVKAFGGIRALNGVHLAIYAGEIVGLIGPNGSGKTTLFNTLTGFLRPDAGTVHVGGREMTGRKPEEISLAGVARTFQTSRPFRDMTVHDNVLTAALFSRPGGLRRAREHAAEVLAQLDLEPLRARPAGALNLVQRKRLEMARALAMSPRVLLLDEVASGLAPAEVDEMTALIGRIRTEWGVAVCIVEHLMRMVMTLSERIVVLDYGQVIAEGAPRDVVGMDQVIEAYLGRRASAAWRGGGGADCG